LIFFATLNFFKLITLVIHFIRFCFVVVMVFHYVAQAGLKLVSASGSSYLSLSSS
jgi:hypothetical protein